MRLAISRFFVIGLGLVLVPRHFLAADPPRLTLTVFRYDGTLDGKGEQAFEQFRGILEDKILNLGQELSSSHPQAKYIERLRMFYSGDRSPDRTQLSRFAAHTGSMGLLSGTVFLEDDAAIVRSRYFLGELGGGLTTDSVVLELPIKAKEFGSIRDSHSAATLYGLAMDAKRLGLPQKVRVECLSRAYSALADLNESNPGVAELKAAVELELRKMRVP